MFFWIREKINWYEWVAMFGSYAGIVIFSLFPSVQEETTYVAWEFYIGVTLTIFGALGMALIGVSTKRIKSCHFTLV